MEFLWVKTGLVVSCALIKGWVFPTNGSPFCKGCVGGARVDFQSSQILFPKRLRFGWIEPDESLDHPEAFKNNWRTQEVTPLNKLLKAKKHLSILEWLLHLGLKWWTLFQLDDSLSLTDAWRACQRFERPGSMSTSWMSAAASCTVGQECARGTVGYSWYLERLDLIAKLIVVTWHLPIGLGLELRLLLKKCHHQGADSIQFFLILLDVQAVDT